jgi:putative endonuclease
MDRTDPPYDKKPDSHETPGTSLRQKNSGTRPRDENSGTRPRDGDRHSPRAREDPRRALGRHGEQLAAAHLQRLGFAVIERNARTRHGEIDLIAFDGRTLVFAEVKTRRIAGSPRRRTGPEEQPLARLRGRQRARLRRLAAAWLHDETRVRPHAHTIRFDAIGVTVDGRGSLVRLDHIEGAW